MLTQANNRLNENGEQPVKRKWIIRIFLISNLQIPIHYLFLLPVSHENEMLVLWLAVNNMRPQQKLLFLFYFFKKYFRIKKKTRQKPMTLLINQALFSFEMIKYANFAEMNMILMTIMRYPSSKFCNSYLMKNFTFIKSLFFFINRFCLYCVNFLWLFNSYDYRDKPQHVLFSN